MPPRQRKGGGAGRGGGRGKRGERGTKKEGGRGEKADGQGSCPLPCPSVQGRCTTFTGAQRYQKGHEPEHWSGTQAPGLLRCPSSWWRVGDPEGSEEELGDGKGRVVGWGDSDMLVGDQRARVLLPVHRIPEVYPPCRQVRGSLPANHPPLPGRQKPGAVQVGRPGFKF